MIIVLVSLGVIVLLWSAVGVFTSRVEQVEYSVVQKTDDYEIRDYPEHIVAQTTTQGSYRESMSSGFRIVAGYIFGDNTRRENIAMTAPVVARDTDSEGLSESIAMTAPVVVSQEVGSRTISFGMPRSYTLETLPTPNDPRVTIVTIPAKKIAATRFGGYRTDARLQKKQQQLLSALARDGVVSVGSPAYAGYSGPGTPPWMMRNEVLVEVVQ